MGGDITEKGAMEKTSHADGVYIIVISSFCSLTRCSCFTGVKMHNPTV